MKTETFTLNGVVNGQSQIITFELDYSDDLSPVSRNSTLNDAISAIACKIFEKQSAIYKYTHPDDKSELSDDDRKSWKVISEQEIQAALKDIHDLIYKPILLSAQAVPDSLSAFTMYQGSPAVSRPSSPALALSSSGPSLGAAAAAGPASSYSLSPAPIARPAPAAASSASAAASSSAHAASRAAPRLSTSRAAKPKGTLTEHLEAAAAGYNNGSTWGIGGFPRSGLTLEKLFDLQTSYNTEFDAYWELTRPSYTATKETQKMLQWLQSQVHAAMAYQNSQDEKAVATQLFAGKRTAEKTPEHLINRLQPITGRS